MNLDEAQTSLDELDKIIQTLLEAGNKEQSSRIGSQEEFRVKIDSPVEEATARSQALSTFFHSHKSLRNQHEYKKLHKQYVATMKRFQQAHQEVAHRRESLCDRELMHSVHISRASLDLAKAEELKALALAEDAVKIKHITQDVDHIVHDQHQGIEKMTESVGAVKVEIGKAVDELEIARKLQAEARRKKMLVFLLLICICAAIIVSIITYFFPNIT